MKRCRSLVTALAFLGSACAVELVLTPGGAAVGQSLALDPTPPKLHCVLAGKSDAWIANAAPGCYSFEISSNNFAAYAKAEAANPPDPHFYVVYRVLPVTWTTLPENSPFRPATGTLAEGDYYHHRTAGCRTYHADGNSCCTASDAPYLCCNDNTECDAAGDPFGCCTGSGTGTCTLAEDSTCGTPEVICWDGCTEADPADCPSSSRWDVRHIIGGGSSGCFSLGGYNRRDEGEHEFVNFASQNVRDVMVADADRLMNGSECDPPCVFAGIRIDEPQLGYSAAGMDFTDILELPIAAAPTEAQNYINEIVSFFEYVKTQRPAFKIFPSLPFFFNDREGDWERQIIHAAQGMATERVGNRSYTRICSSWVGNSCIEGSRAGTILKDDWDVTVDSLSTFARILYGESSPNIEVIIEPFRAGRGMTWLQELCADAGDACYFGIRDGCGAGCYSQNGILSSISTQ